MEAEQKKETEHLEWCRGIIQRNVEEYRKKIVKGRKETEELFAQVRGGDQELYSQLIVSMDVQEHNEHTLHQNEAAYDKPYFGRIDYCEAEDGKEEALYIGKHGIFQDRTHIAVIDWRAPVSTLYYENELGLGSYAVPGQKRMEVDLKLKRTYDIEKGKLIGFYDSDIASNDELLIKYLAKNKDVVLGDIIATIQQEQNEIIREQPFTDIIVQGVAGSGKTTVAMHRISYILYNYEHRFAPEEFCIIGSNDMLLNYITSGLPELDVYHIHQKRMDLFLKDLLDKEWKKKDQIISAGEGAAWKSHLDFILDLEEYMQRIREEAAGPREVKDPQIGTILSEESIRRVWMENPHVSLEVLCRLLNERLKGRIRMQLLPEQKDLSREKVKQYGHYFQSPVGKKNAAELYIEYLLYLMEKNPAWEERIAETVSAVQERRFDVYDLAAMALIRHRMKAPELQDTFSQIIIDEAQDFGVMVYYVLKKILVKAYFTIMGDVSQNIHYELGMNDWEELREKVLNGERQRFYVLAKSYRNTIEISEFAGKILEKASSGKYRIDPVIRHGRPVEYHHFPSSMYARTAELIQEIQGRAFDTVTVICRTAEEAAEVSEELGKWTAVADTRDANYAKGVMVLPIELTKGLEFDAVILWEPTPENYQEKEGDAKLLYVAVTRALHELHIVYSQKLSGFIEEMN